MNLDGIEVFAEVVEAKSFSRAARRLGMPVSTVSAKVARLEERLNVTLIRRTTRQLSVTEAGQTYYEYCVRALAELGEAEQHLAQTKAEPTGVLRITAPPDIAQSILTPIITSFTTRHAAVSVDLTVTNRAVDLIGENIDLAIRVGRLTDSSLIIRKFKDFCMGLWAAPKYLELVGHPKTLADLEYLTLVELNIGGASHQMISENGKSPNIKNAGRIATDDIQSCRAFVEAGAGIGILPDFVGEEGARAKRLVRVLPNASSRPATAYFVYPEQRFVSQNVRAFIDWAKSQQQ